MATPSHGVINRGENWGSPDPAAWLPIRAFGGGDMDDFSDMVSQLREALHEIIDAFGTSIPLEEFEAAGHVGILEFSEEGVAAEDSSFANSLSSQIGCVPPKVVQWMCFAAGYLFTASKAKEKGLPGAIVFLTQAAKHIGYINGYAEGICFEDESRRSMFADSGAKGAKARSDKYESMKNWARERAGNMHGSHKQIARKLSTELPEHFADISHDPERLIYDTLRAPTRMAA